MTRLRHQRIAVAAIAAIAAVVAFLAIGQVKRHHRLVKLSYELSEVTAELRQAAEDNRRLRLERSLLLAPERVERLAGELEMIRPAPEQIRRVGPPRHANRELATR